MSMDREHNHKFEECDREEKTEIMSEFVDYDKEYTPSLWSKRFHRQQDVVPYHVDFVTSKSEYALNNIPHKTEIEYDPNSGQKLDIFGTDLPNSAPILVFVHGGYWMELSREVSRYPAPPLHRARVKTAVVGYDLCPGKTLMQINDQVRRAAKFIFEYAERMGSKGVYLAGHSAGAYLVAKLLADRHFVETSPGSKRLQGVFLLSGIYDIRDLVKTKMNGTLRLSDVWTRVLSPIYDNYSHLDNRDIRFYIITAEHESPTFKRQSREFYQLMQGTCTKRSPYLEIKDDMDHFSLVECLTEEDNYLKNLLLHDLRKYAAE